MDPNTEGGPPKAEIAEVEIEADQVSSTSNALPGPELAESPTGVLDPKYLLTFNSLLE